VPRVSGAPPGRAGRNWLRRRLATAQRGRTQLDRKLRVLYPERQRLQLVADRQREVWVAACAQARTWHLRDVLLSGEDGVRLSSPAQTLTAEVTWTSSMGLRYPADVRLSHPDDSDLLHPNAASDPAAAAFRSAVVAGARAAAAEEAVRRIDAEIAVTRRRLRALEKRWLPRLETSLRELDLTLEQAEQEDSTRLRHASAQRTETRGHP
jgi:V/A-type H+-transporting ATPase subunit D